MRAGYYKGPGFIEGSNNVCVNFQVLPRKKMRGEATKALGAPTLQTMEGAPHRSE